MNDSARLIDCLAPKERPVSARPFRAGVRIKPQQAPKWASGLVPVAHFGAYRKRRRYPALPGRAITERPVGPKTKNNHNTSDDNRAKHTEEMTLRHTKRILVTLLAVATANVLLAFVVRGICCLVHWS